LDSARSNLLAFRWLDYYSNALPEPGLSLSGVRSASSRQFVYRNCWHRCRAKIHPRMSRACNVRNLKITCKLGRWARDLGHPGRLVLVPHNLDPSRFTCTGSNAKHDFLMRWDCTIVDGRCNFSLSLQELQKVI